MRTAIPNTLKNYSVRKNDVVSDGVISGER